MNLRFSNYTKQSGQTSHKEDETLDYTHMAINEEDLTLDEVIEIVDKRTAELEKIHGKLPIPEMRIIG